MELNLETPLANLEIKNLIVKLKKVLTSQLSHLQWVISSKNQTENQLQTQRTGY